MNNYQIIGKIGFLEVKKFFRQDGTTATKTSWLLSTKKGNQFNNLPCESWNSSSAELVDGMSIELIEYIPTQNRYPDKNTGQIKSRFFLDVKKVRIVDNEEISNGFFVGDIPPPEKQQKFNVKEEVQKIMNDLPVEEEDVIDLEWEDQQRDILKQMEEDLQTPKQRIEEILQDSVKTTPYEEDIEIEKKIQELSKRVVTQEELDKINNIEKIQEETAYDGESGLPNTKIFTKEEDW